MAEAPVKLMLTRWAIILLYLLGHHPAFTVSQTIITIEGYFAANEPLSVVAANPIATTLIGTNILTITFEGHPTIGTQISTSFGTQTGTIINIFVIGPSTAASTELLPGLSATDACVLTRSLNTGSCYFESTALNTDSGMSIWTTLYETYTLPRLGLTYYTVTAGQEKLSVVTTTTTSSISPTSSVPSASFPTSPIPPPTTNPASNSSTIAPTTGLDPSLAMPTVSRATMRHDTRYLSNAIVGLAAVVVVALFSCF
jgi:hypothetical protein